MRQPPQAVFGSVRRQTLAPKACWKGLSNCTESFISLMIVPKIRSSTTKTDILCRRGRVSLHLSKPCPHPSHVHPQLTQHLTLSSLYLRIPAYSDTMEKFIRIFPSFPLSYLSYRSRVANHPKLSSSPQVMALSSTPVPGTPNGPRGMPLSKPDEKAN